MIPTPSELIRLAEGATPYWPTVSLLPETVALYARIAEAAGEVVTQLDSVRSGKDDPAPEPDGYVPRWQKFDQNVETLRSLLDRLPKGEG